MAKREIPRNRDMEKRDYKGRRRDIVNAFADRQKKRYNLKERN